MSSQKTPIMTRPHLFALAFFSVLAFLLYQLARLLAPFSSAFLWAAIVALALHPVYTKMVSALRGRAGLAAAFMTAAAVFLVIGPAIALLAALAAQAIDLYQWASELVRSGRLAEEWSSFTGPLLERLPDVPLLSELDVKGAVIKGLGDVSSGLAAHIGGMVKDMLTVVVNLVIMLISLFFFFRNGEAYYHSVTDILPFEADQKRTIAKKLHDTFTAVINGVFLIALLQGLMTGIGFALFGVPFFIFWGVLAAVLALLPIGGAALVWLPGALYLYLKGGTGAAILLAVWGTVLVSLPDNFLKPMIIGRKAKIPSFFLFVAILGGLQVYGVLGILLGPLVVTLLAAFIQIYRDEYAEQ